jgi:hypothetical protein
MTLSYLRQNLAFSGAFKTFLRVNIGPTGGKTVTSAHVQALEGLQQSAPREERGCTT